MLKQEIIKIVKDLAETCAEKLNLKLWDVEFVKDGSDYLLRIIIDSENGINLSDCENMTRMIDPLIDEADPIEQSYSLEVSSPGIERVLRTPEHLEAYINKLVKLKLFKACLNNKKEFIGTLYAYDRISEEIEIECEGEIIKFLRKDISKINGYYIY